MKLLVGHDADVAAFVARFAPAERPEFAPGFRAFGVIRDDGALIAGVVFSDWHPEQKRLELSGVSLSRYAFRPPILAALGEYAFGQLGAFRVWARTSIDNRPARAMLKHLGFIEESTQAHWYGPRQHAVTLRVIRPDWERKWSSQEDRKAA